MAAVKYWIDLEGSRGSQSLYLFQDVALAGMRLTDPDAGGRSTFTIYAEENYYAQGGAASELIFTGDLVATAGSYSGTFDRAEIKADPTGTDWVSRAITLTNGNWSWDEVFSTYLETLENPENINDTLVLLDLLMAGNDMIVGSQYDDTIEAGSGDDVIISGLGEDVIFTGDGADIVYDGAGMDYVIDSGADAAIDKVIMSGNINEFAFSFDRIINVGSGAVVINTIVDDESGTTLDCRGVERFVAYDYAVATDVRVGENAGMVYRLYQAAFDRIPDYEGLGFWINALDQGYTLEEVGTAFTTTPEFLNVYGANSSNRTFVNLLYDHVLGRVADDEGFNFWNNALNSGYSRGAVMAVYTECPENVANVAERIGSSIMYEPWVA